MDDVEIVKKAIQDIPVSLACPDWISRKHGGWHAVAEAVLSALTSAGWQKFGPDQVVVARESLAEIITEATTGIAYEQMPHDFKKYKNHDELPNGLRTTGHISLSIIREAVRAIIAAKEG